MTAPPDGRRSAPPAAIAPPRIRRGETLGVVAPAGAVKPERLRRGLDRLGDAFRIRLAPALTGVRAAGVPAYLAASDDQRAAELAAMLADPDVRAIVLARGGYGLTRILARLDMDVLRRDPKPIVGFSDGTALLAWAHAAGVRGIHGPVIAQLGELDASDTARLVAQLTEPAAPPPWTLTSHGTGTFRGPLVAANLTMASLLVGTPWPLPLAGAIAVLEEVGERPYEIDRYLTHLALTGSLTSAAYVIGDLVRCMEPSVPDEGEALRTVLERLAGKSVASGAPIGHGSRNEAIPFGAACELDLDRGVLTCLEGAVR